VPWEIGKKNHAPNQACAETIFPKISTPRSKSGSAAFGAVQPHVRRREIGEYRGGKGERILAQFNRM